MKIALTIVLVSLLAITMNSCKKCRNEDPRARIINNGTEQASVQVKTSGGNTININNIQPGTASEYNSYAPGQVTFTITVSSNDYVKITEMGDCYDYDIAIDPNNNITLTPIDRN
jgi:hypothetical protein